MKSKYLIGLVIVLIIIVASVAIYFFTIQNASSKSKCCEECLYGASHDVRAMDISFVPCSYYAARNVTWTSGEVVEFSSDCKSYFDNNEITVSECR